MVRMERTPTAPPSLAIEKARGGSDYRKPDVVTQLHHDFHGKCYLCEINNLQSIEVEHLKAHHNGCDRDRMFDWNNLFLSCAHCNSVKNKSRYEEKILDCCREEPERCLQQEWMDGHVYVRAIEPASEEAELTAQLITECFEQTNTGIRVFECQTRINELQETLNVLYQNLRKYKKNPTEEKTCRALRGMLDRSYKFAGFTRTYVRVHAEDYPDLYEFVAV